jgi:hypothetical protein
MADSVKPRLAMMHLFRLIQPSLAVKVFALRWQEQKEAASISDSMAAKAL